MEFSKVKNHIIGCAELHNLTVNELAIYFGYSRFYFCRRFKIEFGISPSHLLARIKIKKAKQKVKEKPAISGYNLARHIGLKNEKRLYQFLHHHLGLSIREFKKNVHAGGGIKEHILGNESICFLKKKKVS